MYLLDLINLSFNSACTVDLCPGSAFNSITAAFASQGYYKQADLLYYLNESGLGSLASLIYAISAFAGIVSMVLGAPPRNYMWFFIGPAIYSFLVSTTHEVNGVRWMDMQDGTGELNQAEVWRIAEPGLRNNSYIKRKGISVHSDKPPSGGETNGNAEVSYFFVWVDYFFSSLIEELVPLTGIYYMEEGQDAESNIDSDPDESDKNKNWSILTDDKWSKILDITDAHLSNINLRETFVTFLAGECGDVFSQQIDNARWIAATKGHGDRIPGTVFKGPSSEAVEHHAYLLQSVLSTKAVPVPASLVNYLSSGDNSVAKGATYLDSSMASRKLLEDIENEDFSGGIVCHQFLRIIVHGFKYEAINIYSQLMDEAPGEFRNDPEAVLRSLLYGWGIHKLEGEGAEKEKREKYLVNLILVYLFRNEMAIAPKPLDVSKNSSTERVEGYIDTQIRTVGNKTKYAEVYSWAKMMPYFQGIMMYVLAMAYPFVALMVIVPGWHKIIVTWITFWIWIKTWDLGFAIVKVLERSIWAMLGNDPSAAAVNGKVLKISKYLPYKTECASGFGTGIGDCDRLLVLFDGPDEGMDTLTNSFAALGRALGLAGNLSLDLTNSYYIYIMTALYFAVPGVTGQLVLGAKSGAANLVGGAIQGFGDANKGAAGAGSQSHLANAVQSNAAVVGQQAYAKGSAALSVQALDSQNSAADFGMASQAMSTRSQLASNVGGAWERRNQSLASQLSPIDTAGLAHGGLAKGISEAGQMGAQWSGLYDAASQADASGGGASAPGGGAPGGSPGGAPGGIPVIPLRNLAAEAAGAATRYDRAALAASAELKNRTAQPVFDANNEINAANSDRMVDSFQAQNQQTQAQTHGQRMGGYANFKGESAASRASMQFANQVGAYATVAAGTMGGSLVKPLPMPTQDSAMSGMLDSYRSHGGYGFTRSRDGARSANHFAAGGAFSQGLNGHVAGMRPIAGDAVRAAYGGGHDNMLGSLSEADVQARDVSALVR